jgi:hypothetical protein
LKTSFVIQPEQAVRHIITALYFTTSIRRISSSVLPSENLPFWH